MRDLKIGFIGSGNIARIIASTINKLDGLTLYAVASRDAERASAFADEMGFIKYYGSYDEMFKDEEVELVYISTPHSHHYEQALMCLNHGKHVLCEKAFTANARQAKELIDLASEKKLFIAEAMWTRFQPFVPILQKLLVDGLIGKPTFLSSNLCVNNSFLPRMSEPELAGGALLDLGIYTLTIASIAFGNEIKTMAAQAVITEKGVDASHGIVLTYQDGKMASLYSSMCSSSDCKVYIGGTAGRLILDNLNHCKQIELLDNDGHLIKTYHMPDDITGYEFELLAVKDAIEKGLDECPQMPHSQTLQMMELMDELRGKWGVRYPFE